MSRLTNALAIWISLLVITGYMVLYYNTDYITSKFAADWVALIGLTFMSISTLPVAYRAFMNGIKSDRDRFIFSYWLIWTLICLHRCWIILLAQYKNVRPDLYDGLYNSPVSGLIALGFALAAGFGTSAVFSSDLPIPRRELIIFTVAAGFSGIMAGIAIGVFIVSGWSS